MSKKHVVIVTSGSRGDVQPYVALAQGLQRAGAVVTVATHAVFRHFVEAAGLRFRLLAGDPVEMLQSPTGQKWIRSGRNSLAFAWYFIRLNRPILPALLRSIATACQDADFILFSPFAGGGLDVAEKKAVPSALAALQPFHPTTAFPAMGAVGTFEIPSMNRMSHRVADLILWLPFRDIFNRWRRRELNLPPAGFGGGLARLADQNIPSLLGYSPSLLPPAPDWDSNVHVTGYWFMEDWHGWRAPTDLDRFLADGPPPIYVGFGSMMRRDSAQLPQLVAEMAARLDRRVVLQRGWQGDSWRLDDRRVYLLDHAPHNWLFPRMSLVVHHGGAGTTAAALRAGVPAVFVPHFADQFFWADLVAKRGASAGTIDRGRLTAARLSAAIAAGLGDKALQQRAADLGRRVRQEAGIDRAVELLLDWL